MTKEELIKEAEEYYEDETEGTFEICEDCYWFADAVQTAYVDSAEPREKQIDELKAQIKVLEQNLEDTEICENGLKNRIAELEDKLANADYQLEGRDNEIRELKAQLEREKKLNQCLSDHNEQLREMIEKMKHHSNCKHRSEYNEFDPYSKVCQSCCNLEKWEFGEIKEK